MFINQNKKYFFYIIQKYLIILGVFFVFYSNQIKAQIIINRDSSYQHYREETDYWNEQGKEYFENDDSNWRKALQAHEKAYQVAALIDYSKGKVTALRQKAMLESRFDNRYRAEKYFLEEIKLRRKINNLEELAITNYNVGLFYANVQGDYELSIGYLLQSFSINQKIFEDSTSKMKKDYEAIIKSGLHLEEIARIKTFQDKYLALYFVAEQNFFEAAQLCVDWANKYIQSKDYENAFYFIKKAEVFAEKLPINHQYKEYFEEHKKDIELKYINERNTIYRTKLLAYGLVVMVVGIGLASFYFSWRVILLRSKK